MATNGSAAGTNGARGVQALYGLPAEMLINILDQLDMVDLPAFVAAAYPLLRHHGLAPPLAPRGFTWMERPRYSAFALATSSILVGIRYLPLEILVHVTRHLSVTDKIRFIIANWGLYPSRYTSRPR